MGVIGRDGGGRFGPSTCNLYPSRLRHPTSDKIRSNLKVLADGEK